MLALQQKDQALSAMEELMAALQGELQALQADQDLSLAQVRRAAVTCCLLPDASGPGPVVQVCRRLPVLWAVQLALLLTRAHAAGTRPGCLGARVAASPNCRALTLSHKRTAYVLATCLERTQLQGSHPVTQKDSICPSHLFGKDLHSIVAIPTKTPACQPILQPESRAAGYEDGVAWGRPGARAACRGTA